MDSRAALMCSRSLVFGCCIGGLVGFVAAGVDTLTAAVRAVPRPTGAEIARVALRTSGGSAVGSAAVFSTYHAAKCAMLRMRLGADDLTAGAGAAVAALSVGVVMRPRPHIASCMVLVVLDSAPAIMALVRAP